MSIRKKRVSPRQKMINLLYVVLMAMLALNVSTEVLEGFSVVEESLHRTTENASKENQSLYNDFSKQMLSNPQKVKAWFEKATLVKQMSDSLYNLAEQLKLEIVREADGKEANPLAIRNKENLEAAAHVMLSPTSNRGKVLFQTINRYRNSILQFVGSTEEKRLIESNLTTAVPASAKGLGKNWQEYMFESMPVAAAVTLLSKLQSDVRHAEGMVLHDLVSNVDLKDIRVNKLTAFVIPESKTVLSGDRFSARIVMAAVDTTQQPEIYIGGRKVALKNSVYELMAGGVGEHSFNGFITMKDASGNVIRRDFSQKYTVVSPAATVSADLMNVLYAGYDNPISISIPGVPLQSVSANMSGGSFRSIGLGRFIAKPTTIGSDVFINVASKSDKGMRNIGRFAFHVRKLPDPIAYLSLGTDRFKGGIIAKGALLNTNGLSAAIDDGLLDIRFNVTSFETVFFDNMGNAVPMISEGSHFSTRQKDEFRKLSRNKRFYISKITAVGPDGISRKLPSSMEVIVR